MLAASAAKTRARSPHQSSGRNPLATGTTEVAQPLKIVVVGAGSSYTPELFASLTAGVRSLPVEEVALVDLNADRLEFIAGVARRILDAAASPMRLTTTTDLEQAVDGADFVIPQIRVGGLAARKRDEALPMSLGMVGNETTGAGGFVCALRTVPAVARDRPGRRASRARRVGPEPEQPGRDRDRGAPAAHAVARHGLLQHPDQHRAPAGRDPGRRSRAHPPRVVRPQPPELAAARVRRRRGRAAAHVRRDPRCHPPVGARWSTP